MHLSAERSSGARTCSGLETLPEHLEVGPSTSAGPNNPITNEDGKLAKTLEIVQSFMVKKGIINSSMTADELQAFLYDESKEEAD